jgi:3-methyladenine DNA glycosylase AlkC
VPALKAEPWRARTLLEPLKADPSLYVRNSVANWLNDASRTQPDWVRQVCGDWQRGVKRPETEYIVRRALRTVNRSAPVPD